MHLDDRLRAHLAATGDRLDPTAGDPERVGRRARRRTVRNRVGGAALAVAVVAGGTGVALTLADDSSEGDTEIAVADATPVAEPTPEPSPGVITDAPPPPGSTLSSLVGVDHLVAAGDGYLAVGAPTNGARGLWTSTDGTDWERVTLPADGVSVGALASADGTHVLVGTDTTGTSPVAYTSTDLADWTEVALAVDLPGSSPGIVWRAQLDHVAVGPAGTLAVGSAHSDLDLAAVVPADVSADGGYQLGSPQGDESITVFDPDTGAVAWTSSLAQLGFTQQEIDGLVRGQGLPVVVRIDGATGESVATSGLDDAAVHELVATADGFVATGLHVADGSPGAWISADGATWTATDPPVGADPGAGALPAADLVWLVGTVDTSGTAAPGAWSTTDGTTWAPVDLASAMADPGRTFTVVDGAGHRSTAAAVFTADVPQDVTTADAPPALELVDGAYSATVDLVTGDVVVVGPGGDTLATFTDWILSPDVAVTTGQAQPPPNVPAPDGPEPPSLPNNIERDGTGGFVLTDGQGGVLASFPTVIVQVDQLRSEWTASQPAAAAQPPTHHWLAWTTAGGSWQARSLDGLLAPGEWVQTIAVADGTALLAVATPPTDEELAAFEDRQEQATSGAAENPTLVAPAPTIRFEEVSLG